MLNAQGPYTHFASSMSAQQQIKITIEKNRAVFKARRFAIELQHGDALPGLEKLRKGKADVVVTSPPYNIGIGYGAYDDTISRTDYLAWLNRWADLVERALGEDGSLFLNLGSKPKDPWVGLQAAMTVAGAQSIADLSGTLRFQLQNTFHWIKSISIDPQYVGQQHQLSEPLSVGHYKPINSKRFVNDTHEYLFHFSKRGTVELDRLSVGVPYQDKSNTTRWRGAKNDVRCRGNCWFMPYETIQIRADERPHPATFPVQLAEWSVRMHGLERARLVVDPFLGLGSSAVACAQLGVSFLGFEIDREYYRGAVARLEELFSAKE